MTENQLKEYTAKELPKLQAIYSEICMTNADDDVVNAIFAAVIYQKMND